MFTKKFISFTVALAVCISSPLHASGNLRGFKEKLRCNSLIEDVTQDERRAQANEERDSIVDDSRKLLSKFTNSAKNCLKNYATEYLSGHIQLTDDTAPRISLEQLHDLLVNYITTRYPGTIVNDDVNTQISDMLSQIDSSDPQGVPLHEFTNYVDVYVTNAFRNYMFAEGQRGKIQHVPQSRFKRDMNGDQINLCIPDEYLQYDDSVNDCAEEGFGYIGIMAMQDCVDYYIRENSSEDPNYSRYLATTLMDEYLCDFFIMQMFVSGLQLDCEVAFRHVGSNMSDREIKALLSDQAHLAELAKDTSRFGQLGHDVENFESSKRMEAFLPIPTSYTVNSTSFDMVFMNCLTNLIGTDVITSKAACNRFKTKIKDRINRLLEKRLTQGYHTIFPTVAALRSANADISVESLIHTFNAGMRDDTATKKQIDALIQRVDSYRH